jgi:hypothetical protein
MRGMARVVITVALMFYCAGIVITALYPIEHITWGEWLVALVASLSAVGLVAYLTPNLELPGERYAYLVTGGTGIAATLLYLLSPDNNDPTHVQVRVTLLLLSGIVMGYGAFWAAEVNKNGR